MFIFKWFISWYFIIFDVVVEMLMRFTIHSSRSNSKSSLIMLLMLLSIRMMQYLSTVEHFDPTSNLQPVYSTCHTPVRTRIDILFKAFEMTILMAYDCDAVFHILTKSDRLQIEISVYCH